MCPRAQSQELAIKDFHSLDSDQILQGGVLGLPRTSTFIGSPICPENTVAQSKFERIRINAIKPIYGPLHSHGNKIYNITSKYTRQKTSTKIDIILEKSLWIIDTIPHIEKKIAFLDPKYDLGMIKW